jgi:uncharacterized protein YutE (UPF0331/DUF86 family)
LVLSPLLRSALESFEHASEQYVQGTDKSRRICVQHCDQAVELLLKEKLRAIGESIYEKGGRTVEFHDALHKLMHNKGVKIPEAANLELVHDQRNIIQHRGAEISKQDAEFYMKTGYDFIKRFLKDELGFKIENVLDKRYFAPFEEEIVQGYEIVDVKEVVRVTKSHSANAATAVLLSYQRLVNDLSKLAASVDLPKDSEPEAVLERLVSSRRLPQVAIPKFKMISEFRNMIAHTDRLPTVEEMADFGKQFAYLSDALSTLK